MTEDRVAGQRVTGQRVAGQRVTGQRVTGQRVAGQRVAGQRVTGQRVAGQGGVGQGGAGAIPYRLRVGVTGHRRLSDEAALREQVAAALQCLRRLVPASNATPVHLTVVSSLAEGADRLVAWAVLEQPDSLLEVILPLPAADYRDDFATDASKRAFDELLARADEVTITMPGLTRAVAYERAGKYMAERCDALIALWDGRPARGQGGTAEIVAFAREQHIPLVWIDTTPPFRRHEEGLDHDRAPDFAWLDRYNRETIDERTVALATQRQTAALLTAAERAGLPADAIRPFCQWLVPDYVRADTLAQRYQRRFLVYGAAIFLLAAAATVTVSFQRQYFPQHPIIALVEVLFIVLNWIIVYQGRHRGRLKQRWLTYRALAERLRSGLFVAMVHQAHGGPNVKPAPLYRVQEEWVDRAYEEAWRRRPRSTLTGVPVEQLKRFLLQAWLADQVTFMRSRNRMQAQRDVQITWLGNIAWGVTILVVTLHALRAAEASSLSALLIVLAITLPAFASALRAIVDQREYTRNATRYDQIAHVLAILMRRMEMATTLDDLYAVAGEAEAVLREENRAWVFEARFRDLMLQQ